MLNANISCLNAVSNGVIVDLDMVRVCLEHWVPSYISNAHVVVVKGNKILDWSNQILQDSLESDSFTCTHSCTLVFNLCALSYNNQLCLATPGYCSIDEGENKVGGRSRVG